MCISTEENEMTADIDRNRENRDRETSTAVLALCPHHPEVWPDRGKTLPDHCVDKALKGPFTQGFHHGHWIDTQHNKHCLLFVAVQVAHSGFIRSFIVITACCSWTLMRDVRVKQKQSQTKTMSCKNKAPLL